jgi:ABC-type lipoprotein release transport system permease subunit
VSTADPLIYFSVPAVILVVALIACFIPAQKASSGDPCISLRHD